MILQSDGVFPCARKSGADFFVKTVYQESYPGLEIVFLHDLFDYHGSYLKFAEHLASHGHRVHLIDFRGFGRSGGARGQIDRHDDLVDDVEGYIKSIPQRVVLGGHSFGALIAIRLLHRQSLPEKHALKALILSNPMLRLTRGLPSLGRMIFERLSHPFDLIPLPWKLLPHERCRDDIAATYAIDDPLMRDQILLRTFREVEQLTKLEQNASYLIDVPTLTLLPASDALSSLAYARLFTKAIDHELSDVLNYTQAYRDLMNDNGYADVYKDVSQWLKLRFL